MARRRRSSGKQPFLIEVTGALLRLSHRVPFVGVGVAIACGVGWWYLRKSPALWGAAPILGMILAVIGGFFLLLAIIGLLRNLFPERSERERS
jgi:hypothetical protein